MRAGIAALMVLTVLVPSDSVEVHDGKGLLLVLLWLLFGLAWCIPGVVTRNPFTGDWWRPRSHCSYWPTR